MSIKPILDMAPKNPFSHGKSIHFVTGYSALLQMYLSILNILGSIHTTHDQASGYFTQSHQLIHV